MITNRIKINGDYDFIMQKLMILMKIIVIMVKMITVDKVKNNIVVKQL